MYNDTNVETIILNKMTREKFESIEEKDPTQFYTVVDDNTHTEVWTFTLEDGSTVTKKMIIGD